MKVLSILMLCFVMASCNSRGKLQENFKQQISALNSKGLGKMQTIDSVKILSVDSLTNKNSAWRQLKIAKRLHEHLSDAANRDYVSYKSAKENIEMYKRLGITGDPYQYDELIEDSIKWMEYKMRADSTQTAIDSLHKIYENATNEFIGYYVESKVYYTLDTTPDSMSFDYRFDSKGNIQDTTNGILRYLLLLEQFDKESEKIRERYKR